VTAPVGEPAARAPSVDVRPASGTTTAVAVVLAGGRAHSFAPSESGHLALLRMRPFAALLHRRGSRHGLAVWTVRYRYRGWNGDERSPVADTRWALDEVRRRHGDVPVVLVGHSMGGRTAFAAGGDASVRGICALAPWTEEGDPVQPLAGKTVLIAHGNLDVVTSPRASRRYAERLRAAGARVGYVVVTGDLHAMVFRWRRWHRLATGFSLGVLGFAPMPRRIERAFSAPL
jgi:alpha-beta hydrolase superfamily lysophospholipase